ncbi:MAG: 1-acyl-sn-glycerol-3-phosphate acyltransferase [Clostridiales bacterium]|nr:1-acyl-sn-glycerol-3-phosphate acyltransferase [Clostridiales bacterium]
MKFGRFLLWFFHPLYWFLFPFKAYGKENIPAQTPDDRTILCCNHISEMDPVYLEMCQKRHVFFMAKAELFRGRFSRWFIGRLFGAFPVERGKGDTGALDKAEEIVNSGRLLGIFPEGTRSRDGQLGRVKSGAALIAARTGANILPVCIVAKDQKVRLFHRAKVIFGKPMTPQELHLDDPERPDLRFASRALMQRIGEMIDQANAQ